MAEIRDRTYADGAAVETDGISFVNCRFEAASLHYSGGPHPTFQDCSFSDIGWYFTGSALRTIQLLQQIANGGGEAFIADLFRPGHYIGE